jgi:hypothetical protein
MADAAVGVFAVFLVVIAEQRARNATATRQERVSLAIEAHADPKAFQRLRRCEGPCSASAGAPTVAGVLVMARLLLG